MKEVIGQCTVLNIDDIYFFKNKKINKNWMALKKTAMGEWDCYTTEVLKWVDFSVSWPILRISYVLLYPLLCHR